MYVGHKITFLVKQNALLSSISQNVNLTYSIVKNWFLHLHTYNAPQKIWQTIWKIETKVVIDKTRVGGAFAFHKRNCLLTKNLKAEYL